MVRLLALGLSLAAGVSEAGLKWETTRIQLAPAFGDTKTEAVFAFTNEGNATVSLTQVVASCGCTVPELKQRTFAPGESGTIRAVYTIGQRQGLNRSTISVRTDTPGSDRHSLSLEVDIPVAIQVMPRTVNWRIGEVGTPKTMTVKIHPEVGLKLTEILGLDEHFSAQIEPGKEAGQYEIAITPSSTATRQRATFSLEFDQPQDRPVQVFAFVF